MSLRIAVAGKGGTGKTTLSAALVLYLGLAESTSLADIREEKEIPAGMSKLEYMNLRVQECLSEGRGVDLICMGRPEGPGCYCAVNHLLRNELSKLQHGYPVVIIDNEAGMEHLSRRTTDDVDVLLVVMGPDKASTLAAERILAMVPQLQIKVGRILLVAIRREPGQSAVENAYLVPEDPAIKSMAIQGQTIFEIPSDSAALTAVRQLWKIILQEEVLV
jgi:CO dehydrogenase maturation factor